MDDAAALIASMRAKPEEDTPRLAYADLVEERGEHDRAELIRVQVARARLNPRPVLRVFRQFAVGEGGHGQAEFRGDFVGAPGLRLTPGLTFDAVVGTKPGEPLKTRAVGCVIERLNPPMYESGTISLEGHVTGIPCPVRPEADALDERAAALMLRIPFGEFCPPFFVWHIGAADFEQAVTASVAYGGSPIAGGGAVLVRRGFVEHVRCSWEDWARWADRFRANHPCERVTLTTEPVPHGRSNPRDESREIFIKGVPGGELVSEKELLLSRDRGRAAIWRAVTRLLARNWPGTAIVLTNLQT